MVKKFVNSSKISDVNVYMWNGIYMFTLIYVIEKNIDNVISCNIYMSYKYTI